MLLPVLMIPTTRRQEQPIEETLLAPMARLAQYYSGFVEVDRLSARL